MVTTFFIDTQKALLNKKSLNPKLFASTILASKAPWTFMVTNVPSWPRSCFLVTTSSIHSEWSHTSPPIWTAPNWENDMASVFAPACGKCLTSYPSIKQYRINENRIIQFHQSVVRAQHFLLNINHIHSLFPLQYSLRSINLSLFCLYSFHLSPLPFFCLSPSTFHPMPLVLTAFYLSPLTFFCLWPFTLCLSPPFSIFFSLISYPLVYWGFIKLFLPCQNPSDK